MTDPVSLPFVLNQPQIDAAIASELPRLLKDLKFDYVSGRAPNGLRASVELTETMIRQAVIAHARKLVNPTFLHFSIEFQPTRGEDGLTASIIASTAPITPETATETKAAAATPAAALKAAPAATHEDVGAKAERPDTSATAAAETAAEATVETAAVEAAEDKSEGVADIATDTGAAAPFDTEQTEDAAIAAPADAPAEAAAVEKAAEPEATAAPAPAAGRSRLFADLQRPSN
jgi:hypothetical protein